MVENLSLPILFLSISPSKVLEIIIWQLLSDVLASPEYIFAGKYPILNANLFKAGEDNAKVGLDNTVKDIWNGAGTATIQKLRTAVAGIYVGLRNVCAVILLCLLIYTGIRIVLSASMPNEQAKWKGYLIDWIKALLLLIFIHLIMITIFYVTDLLAGSLINALGDGDSIVQVIRKDCGGSWDFVAQAICLIMYLYCTYLTIIFAIAYFKRVVWTAFLIILAPIVSALYAIGGQGKTIYKGWFKEFLLNCLIQPFHVIIYFTLILLPIRLSTQGNEIKLISSVGEDIFLLIYCLIAMSLIRPAERFIRNLFGMSGGKIANTASFDSGKQLADAIGNAIKQTIITATSVGAAIATGGATAVAGNAMGSGAYSNAGRNLGNGAHINGNNPINNDLNINNPLGAVSSGVGDGLQVEEHNGERRLVFPNAENEAQSISQSQPLNQIQVEEHNGERKLVFPNAENQAQSISQSQPLNQSQNQTQGQGQGASQPQGQSQASQTNALGDFLNGAYTTNNVRPQGRLDRLLDRLMDRVGGRFTSTPEQTKATFDAIDKMYEWRHMVQDLGREFGDLEAGPGHRPMRMTPFLRERANNRLAGEERQLNAMAESFANDSSVVDFYKKRIENDEKKIKNLRERYTRSIKDKDGKEQVYFDELKFKEEIKDEAEREARKSSEFVKYGYTDLHQIDQMRLRAKEAGVKVTEDVIRYNANYAVLERDRSQRGQDVNSDAIKAAIREELRYLNPGQNINGAAIPTKIVEKETMPRESTAVLNKLTEIGRILGNRVQDDYRVGSAKNMYAIIERGRRDGVVPNMNGIDPDIQEYITREIRNR